MSKMATRLALALVLVVLVVAPTCCNAARELRGWGRSEPRSLFEARREFEKLSTNWSDQESGDDAVPTSSSPLPAADHPVKLNKGIRYQEHHHETDDYADTPAAANPSIPCC